MRMKIEKYHRMAMAMIYMPATIKVSLWVSFGVKDDLALRMRSSFGLFRCDSSVRCTAMDIIDVGGGVVYGTKSVVYVESK